MASKIEKTNAPESNSGREMSDTSDRDARIAELAYFKAEQRGFAPGHELEDWLEAERECTLNEPNKRGTVVKIHDDQGVAA